MATVAADAQQADTAQGHPDAPDGPGTEVTAVQRGLSVTTAARFGFTPDQIVALRRSLAPKASAEELVVLLELCARYELDPFARHVWCAPMSGDDGPHSIFCGRDGYLAIANRSPDFEGVRSAPVYENDEFEMSVEGKDVHVSHRSGKPADRGDLIGAYAVAYRDGRVPTYFFADVGEYRPDNPNRRTPWFKQPSAMLKKCAESNALRIAYSISGFVPAEEAAAVRGREPVNPTAEPPSPYGDDEIGQRLEQAVERANAVRPGAYRPARLRMDLTGATDAEREAYAAQVEGEADRLEAAAGIVTDAVVVDDAPDAPDATDPDTLDPAEQPTLDD